MSLQQVQPTQAFPPELGRWPIILTAAAQLAERVAGTEFVPKSMRGKPEVVVAAIMYGDEIGIGPMQALAGIDIVDGRPRPNAELLRALILRDGHTISVHEMSPQRCRLSGLRAGRPESDRVYVEWTLDMARSAGLAGKQNWRQYPRAMLLARATSDLARAAFPDVVRGLGYVSEVDESLSQLQDWAGSGDEDETGATSPAPVAPELPARPAVQRKTKPKRTQPATDLDDLRPESQSPEPPSGPREKPGVPSDARLPEGPARITPGPLQAIQAKVGKLLPKSADRAERLALLEAILGNERRLESSKDLTRTEGYRVLEFLDLIEKGDAFYRVDRGGQYVVGMSDDALPLVDPDDVPPDVEIEDLPPGAEDVAADPWQDPLERERELRESIEQREDES